MENKAEILFDLIAQKSFEELSNSEKESVLEEMSMHEYRELRNAYLASNEIYKEESSDSDFRWDKLENTFDKKHASNPLRMQLISMFVGIAASFTFFLLVTYIWFWPPKIEQVVSIERVTDTVYVQLPEKPMKETEATVSKEQTRKTVISVKAQAKPNTYAETPKSPNLYVRGSGNLLDEHNKLNSLKVDTKELPEALGFVSLSH